MPGDKNSYSDDSEEPQSPMSGPDKPMAKSYKKRLR